MGLSCVNKINKDKKEIIIKAFKFTNNIVKTIKSKYIINNIFSYLYEIKKLELIKYNKKSQKILKIDIYYYKQISGKVLKDEGNGKYKIYSEDNILLFEGGYKNGKKHGKGKEYYNNGYLKFEGEYLNGKKIKGIQYNKNNNGEQIAKLNVGKGKEYYKNGKLRFAGEYLNGKRWNGKYYNINGNIDHELKYGTGKGKEYDNLFKWKKMEWKIL